MKCPKCGDRKHVDIGEGDGFSQDIRECQTCGFVWTFNGNDRVIIKECHNG